MATGVKRASLGVGTATGSPVRLNEFYVDIDGVMSPFLDFAQAKYYRNFIDDKEKSEYFVPVEWICPKTLTEAVSEAGFFGNQNTVARPRTHKWTQTIERLKHRFGIEKI